MKMAQRKTMKATVTKDAKKLWSCSNFRILTSTEHRGELPISSGEEIILFLPGETPSPWCDAKRAWEVAVQPKSMRGNARGFKVCEHQVDIPEEG
jgi:hypothetical protein